MIPPDILEDIRNVSVCADVVGDFIKLKKEGTNMVACCPFHDEKSPSFKVDLKTNMYKCFGCSEAGSSIEFLQKYKKMTFLDAVKYLGNKYQIEIPDPTTIKVYVKPAPKNVTALSDNMLKWFQNRKINQKTLIQMQVTQSKEWMYAKDKHKEGEVNCINFNYYRNGELVNIKYRDGAKRFKMYKDAELVFYNLDSLQGATEAIICEGELDCLALIEAGVMKSGTAMLSVPNGANVKSNNLSYIDNSIHLFKDIKLIIIGVDDDAPGRKLREDLAQRFGKERSRYVEWNGQKDANDLLIKEGPEAVQKCCNNHIRFPIEGVFTIEDYSSSIDDIYTNGIERGNGIGLDTFDKLLRIVTGWITVITGLPSSGKSDWVDQWVLQLMLRYNWRGAFYSPENDPFALHFSKLARKLIGKPWYGQAKISEQEKELAKHFLEDKLWIIKPPSDFTLDTILASVKILIQEFGIKWFVIDAWNRLEHKYGKGQMEAQYVQESLTKLDAFCRHWNVHCFLVAHPTKMILNLKTNKYPVPRLYDISGGAHFRNICANGVCVDRNYNEAKTTTIYVQKVKFIPYWGEMGQVDMKYDLESGRFYEAPGGMGVIDHSNWITKENRQVKADLPTETIGMSILKPEDELPF